MRWKGLIVTKAEQKVLDCVRATNDRGSAEFNPVGRTLGRRVRSGRWGWSYEGRAENKREAAAFARLLADGALVEVFGGGYAIPGHEVLAAKAAEVDLMKLARYVAQRRTELDAAEARFDRASAFVRENSK
jgi:hypothetical protein